MQNQFDPRTTTGVNAAASVGVPRAARDAGLRSYMLSVYNYMASGVLLTGIVALLFANSGLAAQVLATPLRWVIIFAPLAAEFAFVFSPPALPLVFHFDQVLDRLSGLSHNHIAPDPEMIHV